MLALNNQILKVTNAASIIHCEEVQSLWSDYGAIKRYKLAGGEHESVIVKHIQLPDNNRHPKGWNTPISHQRKLASYKIECKWYQRYAGLTNKYCRVPQCFQAAEDKHELFLIMEDLNASGFSLRLDLQTVTLAHAKSCLGWLAHFHAKFMGIAPNGLWPVGTYWHLATRPDELQRMENISLKNAAKEIDQRLNNAHFQTLVHGDAKLANFCFSKTQAVAAVDFQYVGKGCGIKDVAYFISSSFDELGCEKHEQELLEHYFNVLKGAVDPNIDFQSLKEEWTTLYPFAWADFHRFLDGWNPGNWKTHAYSTAITNKVLHELKYS